MSRWQDRQVLRALGWRGTKAKRQRRYVRPELAPAVLVPPEPDPEPSEPENE